MTKFFLGFYCFLTQILHLVFEFYAKIKFFYTKKQDKILNERLCIYKISKEIEEKIKNKKVICFNAASAGEFNAIKKLLTEIDSQDRFIVVMTCTESGYKAFSQYKHPSENIKYVYSPFDFPQVIEKFIRTWNLQALVLVESEIWPNFIRKVSKVGKVAIINARMSPKSFKRWLKFKNVIKEILSKCIFISASSNSDLVHYREFYANPILTGNLKHDANPLKVKSKDLKALQESIKDRPILICASTHSDEEEILLDVYKELLQNLPNLLIIIIPRHVERSQEIEKICFNKKLISVVRDRAGSVNNHIPDEAQVYIANTMGELGTFFSLSKIVFLGGSMVSIGGHNMCEPAMLECAIITGPHTYNFLDLVRDMEKDNGLVVVQDQDQLKDAILDLFNSPDKVAQLGKNAAEFVRKNGGALKKTIKLLEENDMI